MKPTITIVCCANDKFAPGLTLSMASALAKSSGQFAYDFIVLDGGIKSDSKIKLEAILKTISAKVKTDFTLAYLLPSESVVARLPTRAGTWMTYARFLLPELLPDREFAIYLDSDILCMRGVEEFYTSWDREAAVVAVRDPLEFANRDWPFPEKDKLKDDYYFNAGLILMNLNWFRAHYPLTKIMELIEGTDKEKLKFHDQTILNYITHKNSIEIPRENNWVLATEFSVEVPHKYRDINMHYVGRVKPWLRKDTQVRRFFAEYLYFVASEEYGLNAVEPREVNEEDYTSVTNKAFWYKLIKPKRAKLYKKVIENYKKQKDLAVNIAPSDFY